MYRRTNNPNVIERIKDSAFIPESLENMDWLLYQEWLAEGNTPEAVIPPVTTVPNSVTRRQAKLALNQLGILDLVESAAVSYGKAAEIEWKDALEFQRDNALLNSVAIAMGWNESKLDELFTLAGSF